MSLLLGAAFLGTFILAFAFYQDFSDRRKWKRINELAKLKSEQRAGDK